MSPYVEGKYHWINCTKKLFQKATCKSSHPCRSHDYSFFVTWTKLPSSSYYRSSWKSCPLKSIPGEDSEDMFAIKLSGQNVSATSHDYESLPIVEAILMTTLVPAKIWYACSSRSCAHNLRTRSGRGGCNLKVSYTAAFK